MFWMIAMLLFDRFTEAESNLNETVVSYSWKPSFLSYDEFMYLMLEVGSQQQHALSPPCPSKQTPTC